MTASSSSSPPQPVVRGGVGYNGQLREAHAAWQFLGAGYRVYNPVLRRLRWGGGEVTSYLGEVVGKQGVLKLTRHSTAVVFTPQTGAAKEASRIRNEKMNLRLYPRRRQRRQRLQAEP